MEAIDKYLCQLPKGLTKDQMDRITYFESKSMADKSKTACEEMTKRFGWSFPDRIEKLSEEVGELDIEVKVLAAKAAKLIELDNACINTKDTPEYKVAYDEYEQQLAKMLRELADAWVVVTHIVKMVSIFYGNKALHKMMTYVYAKWVIRETIPTWGHGR